MLESVWANHLVQLSRLPSVRQQLRNLTRPLCWQPHQHILEIPIRVMPIVMDRLDQTHHRSSAFATTE
jgi:hypothetical protein